MTLRELSQLYYLKKEIETDKKRLEQLRAIISEPAGQKIFGISSSGGHENRLERYIAEIVDLEAIISSKITQCVHVQNQLERYISEIPDSLTRQIFTLRFVNGYSWEACAAHIGYENTGKNLSNICYRYIKKSNMQNNK